MTRIKTLFETLKRPALISFVMAGDPSSDRCVSILKSLPEAGADVIEIGMPFADPVADGEVIQAAGSRALDAGVNIGQIFDMVEGFRGSCDSVPVVLMGYGNPVFAYGVTRFMQDAKKAGVDGVILVDIPPEESDEFLPAAQEAGLDFIRLVTPTTDAQRLKTILEGASGFLYYVSITGVTGAAKPAPRSIQNHIEMIRSHTDLPVAVGFGIKTPEDAAAFGEIADGVVVGSSIVQTIADHGDSDDMIKKVSDQVRALSGAIQSNRS